MEIPAKQTFRFCAPTAMSVLLVGDFTHWKQRGIPMQKGKDGIWVATVTLPPGKHGYRFIVDGEWRDDPQSANRAPNPFGTENAVLRIA
jgi:1,4-alpha-glucan branching enzyme